MQCAHKSVNIKRGMKCPHLPVIITMRSLQINEHLLEICDTLHLFYWNCIFSIILVICRTKFWPHYESVTTHSVGDDGIGLIPVVNVRVDTPKRRERLTILNVLQTTNCCVVLLLANEEELSRSFLKYWDQFLIEQDSMMSDVWLHIMNAFNGITKHNITNNIMYSGSSSRTLSLSLCSSSRIIIFLESNSLFASSG